MIWNRWKTKDGRRFSPPPARRPASSVLRLPLLTLLSTALLACDPPPEPTATSAPTEAGAAALFVQSGCAACHSIDGSGGLPGPDLLGLADRIAAERGVDAVEPFLRASILDPDKEITEGFQPGLMPPTYGEALTEAEVDQLVAYMQTLR